MAHAHVGPEELRQTFEAIRRHHGYAVAACRCSRRSTLASNADLIHIRDQLSRPNLHSRDQVLRRSSPVPQTSGVYFWFFKALPEIVPTEGCCQFDDLSLLYVGIAPRAPPADGSLSKGQTLRKRIRTHYRGNAASSTLRLTLGCLLSKRLDIELRRVASGVKLAFGREGEQRLSGWMEENAFVCWSAHPEPWAVERNLIACLNTPLNIQGNQDHPFCAALREAREAARQRARQLPVLGRS